MKNEEKNQWIRVAEDLKQVPADRVWQRLESRLDQDKGKVSLSTLWRWLSVAASVIIVLGLGLYLFATDIKKEAILLVEDLQESNPRASFATYQYASDINGYYQSDSWKQIKEGRHKPLVASTQVRIGSAPGSIQQEDSSRLY